MSIISLHERSFTMIFYWYRYKYLKTVMNKTPNEETLSGSLNYIPCVKGEEENYSTDINR